MVKQIIILGFAVLLFNQSLAQKVLNDSETRWVNEAKAELNRALSDPEMSEDERISIIERSARTLKEYGQESAFPSDKIPLAKMMDQNFDKCRISISELNEWSLNLQRKTLDQKLKVINAIQIEVLEDEIELMIPGETAIQLSQEAIGNVFGWNIVEGFNQGETSDARQLTEMFKELAQSKKLVGQIDKLIEDQKRSLKLINEDRTQLKYTEAKLRQKYKIAEATTRTMNGYQGAKPAGTQTEVPEVSSKPADSDSGNSGSPVLKKNVLVGTWKFGFEQTGYFHWTFNNDGSFLFKDNMNDGDERRGKYSVSGNILSLYDSEGCEKIIGKYTFKISSNELSFSAISDQCINRRLTLNHVWKK